MEDDPTASQIFVPSDGDYAITVLRRLFGNSVDTLLGGNGETTGTAILTTVIGTFNVAILFFATIVAAYMMYQLVLDTARDGEAGGRESNLAVTALRAAGGAALLLPVKSGFSVIQILVLQLLLWGSGLGDYVWTTTAGQLQQTATYTASPDKGGDSFITAQKMAGVLSARVAGRLCMLHANNISRTLQTGDGAVTAQGPIVLERTYGVGDGTTPNAEVWFFGADQRYLSRQEVCGSTRLLFAAQPQIQGGATQETVDLDIAQQLTAMTNDTVRQNGKAAVSSLDIAASNIAQQIYSGQRQTETIKREIREAVSKATRDFITGVNSTMTSSASGGGMASLKQSFLNNTTENGWMFAAIWQRGMASYVTKMNDARNQLIFLNSTSVDPKAAVSSIYKSIFGYSNTEERLFASIDSDFSYLKTFDGAFEEAGQPNPSNTTSLERVAANNNEQTGLLSIQWLYSTMFSATKTPDQSNQWSDPLIEIQEQGQDLIIVGGATMGLSSVAGFGADIVSLGSLAAGQVGVSGAAKAASYLADVIGYVGYGILILGMIIAIMLPFLPFVYFLSGAIGWVIMAIEAMVAAPLWILLTFAPHRSGDIIGTNKQGLLLMIGVFFRPVLLILGLLSCFLVMRIGLDFVNVMFTGIYMIVAPDASITNVFLAVGLIAMYVLTLIILVSNCCSIITGLGDAVMEFIGVRASMLGQNSIGTQMEGTLNPASRAASQIESTSGGAASKLGKGIRDMNEGRAIKNAKGLTLRLRGGSGGGGRAG